MGAYKRLGTYYWHISITFFYLSLFQPSMFYTVLTLSLSKAHILTLNTQAYISYAHISWSWTWSTLINQKSREYTIAANLYKRKQWLLLLELIFFNESITVHIGKNNQVTINSWLENKLNQKTSTKLIKK